MENPNFLEPASQPKGHIHKFHGTLILTVAIASMVGYFALASQLPLWPFEAPLSFVASTPQPNQRACTQEAKLCPDGTAVGRTGPNCEFAKCPGEVDISNWKTYRNDEYGFEFKYPGEWTVLDDKVVVEYMDNKKWYRVRVGDDGAKFLIEINPDGYGPFFPIESYTLKRDQNKIIILNREIHEPDENNSYGDYRLLTLNGIEGYSFQYQYNIKSVINYKVFLDQILSTFKFIETADTSNWKTYRNDEYGFEFKYPGDEFTGDGVLNGESNGVDGFFLESGMALDVISILPKGEFDYGISKEADYVKEITFSGKLAKESFWNDLGGQTLKIINITESIPNWSSNNRIEIRSSNKKELLDQILSTFRFLK